MLEKKLKINEIEEKEMNNLLEEGKAKILLFAVKEEPNDVYTVAEYSDRYATGIYKQEGGKGDHKLLT